MLNIKSYIGNYTISSVLLQCGKYETLITMQYENKNDLLEMLDKEVATATFENEIDCITYHLNVYNEIKGGNLNVK